MVQKHKKVGIIATYKGKEYENYEETLSKMDNQILEAMKNLPTVYSSEIDTLDSSIYSIVKSIDDETSTAKMQEYKQKINSIINKRAIIVGNLSPAGASVRKLIDERNEYEAKAKKSNDNIVAQMTGIVSYSTDGLEDKLKASDIEKISYDQITNMVQSNKKSVNKNIKIVDNYEAYIVTRVDKSNKQYINKNSTYSLRLIEDSNYELQAELIKYDENEENIDIYFKITNGIEELVNLRNVELEIVWWEKEGFIAPNKAIFKIGDVDYINVIKYSDVVSIPIKVLKQNDTYSVIRNFETEELQQLGITLEYEIKLHDRVTIKNK